MKALRLLSILAACCATGTVTTAWAAETPAKPAAPVAAKPADAKPAGESAAPKSDEQTQAQPGTKTEEEDEAAQAQKPAAKPGKSGKGGSPERFVPSEQVRADFDVSFPIDI
ncbi:hypothetical protein [Peristeroidobacter soli]|jgi:hypothetical protein|uniref:hypothetical protein n=1 Tax=Peristeroidobacter soli TaxID=2497877 RepID=UPI00101D04B7|nr:hypothetical protein [Peristeroidobacter soli]